MDMEKLLAKIYNYKKLIFKIQQVRKIESSHQTNQAGALFISILPCTIIKSLVPLHNCPLAYGAAIEYILPVSPLQ
jgi:hypothetical protein